MSEETIKNKNEITETWDKVASKFGRVGPRYWDLFGGRLVELSNISEGNTVLDIGCGRGASLFPSAEKIGISGKAIGIDISQEMISETQNQIDKECYKNIKLMQMDGGKLNFPDGFFDVVFCGFGIGYLLQGDTELKNVLRVLKYNGQAAFSIWGIQEDNKWITELVNKYLPPKPPSQMPIKPSKKPSLSNLDGIKEILTASAFRDIKLFEEDKEVVYKDEEEWWEEMWANAVRGSLEKISKLGNERLEEFKNEAFQGLQIYKKSYGICFNRKVIYAFGSK